jgi:hypothetical protein
MSVFGMSEEERKKISEQHKIAMKNDSDKKEELKKGLQKPEEKKVIKKTS